SEAAGGAGAGEPDEMLGRDVRDEQRCADREPADIAACEEVLRRSTFFPREVQTDREDDHKVDSDDDDVHRRQFAMHTSWAHVRPFRSNERPLLVRKNVKDDGLKRTILGRGSLTVLEIRTPLLQRGPIRYCHPPPSER